ncbi:MAG: hypothetical protein HKN43_14360 [Rhodothermales bacterium]|nr:hypothetical protein [Rhodothermales bacterium]
MEELIRQLVPNAPKYGLFVAPKIPRDKLDNAIRDFAQGVDPDDVLVMYDATLMGSAKDGALFTADGFVFQNTDLDAPQEIKYDDIVRVNMKRSLLKGKRVGLDVNQGRATIPVVIDFSGKPKAAEIIARFLSEAMLKSIVDAELDDDEHLETVTDKRAVQSAMKALVDRKMLAPADFETLKEAIDDL